MAAKDKVDELLKDSGAVLLRKKNHEVWGLPNGKIFVRALTTSDRNSEHNNYSDLRRTLGLTPEHIPGERRERKAKNGRPEVIHYTREINTTLADKLRAVGVVEDLLQEKIETLERQNALLIESNNAGCVFCRFKTWLGL